MRLDGRRQLEERVTAHVRDAQVDDHGIHMLALHDADAVIARSGRGHPVARSCECERQGLADGRFVVEKQKVHQLSGHTSLPCKAQERHSRVLLRCGGCRTPFASNATNSSGSTFARATRGVCPVSARICCVN